MTGLGDVIPPPLLALLRGRALTLARPAWGRRQGRHFSAREGHGQEFRGHRGYVPGDELRRLDWRAVARHDRLVLREAHSEDELDIALLIDGSAAMDYGEGWAHKRRHANALAAALASVALRQGDRVGLAIARGPTPDPSMLRPRGGQAQLARIVARVLEDRYEETCPWPLHLAPLATALPRRGLVILLGDLLDPCAGLPGAAPDADPQVADAPLLHALATLRARGHALVIVQLLHRDELEFPWDGRELLRIEDPRRLRADVEGPGVSLRAGYLARLRAHLTWFERGCEREGVHLVRLVSDAPVTAGFLAILDQLAGKPRRLETEAAP
ncbi:MAG: DUF58 domain-containing protein [Myxococcales bacterium]|nr:DUF58 domain-containing protein [Myxococcales bacterium]